jgi:hypothetical protein
MAPVSDVPYIAGQVMSIRTGHYLNKVFAFVCRISVLATKFSQNLHFAVQKVVLRPKTPLTITKIKLIFNQLFWSDKDSISCVPADQGLAGPAS